MNELDKDFFRFHIKELEKDRMHMFGHIRGIQRTIEQTRAHIKRIDFWVAVCSCIYIVTTAYEFLNN